MTVASDLPQVLVIDDEMGPRESLRMLLKPNYQVYTADCVDAGIKLLKEKQPDAVITASGCFSFKSLIPASTQSAV